MTFRSELVGFLNFFVCFLLLMGTNRLCGLPLGAGRGALAAVLGGIHAWACLQPGFSFLGSLLWRLVVLCLTAWLAFGWERSTLRRGAMYLLLTMALGGVTACIGSGSAWSVPAAAISVCAVSILGFHGRPGPSSGVPVELTYGEKQLQVLALRDTGNTLRDPVTGRPVLVVGADVAKELTGLTKEQLRKPVDAVSAQLLPGLRLIPYRSVGCDGGLLLALRLPEVRIGTWKGSSLVAFAPEGLGADGKYQALTGGAA